MTESAVVHDDDELHLVYIGGWKHEADMQYPRSVQLCHTKLFSFSNIIFSLSWNLIFC